MFEKIIHKIVSIFPKKLQTLYYKYESVLLYIFFGGLTTIVSVTAQYTSYYFGANTVLATTISWIFSVTFAFFTNKSFVFKSKTETKTDFFKQLLSFYSARLVSFGLEMGFLLLAVDVIGFDKHIMKLFAQVFILIINYVFSKLVIFKKK